MSTRRSFFGRLLGGFAAALGLAKVATPDSWGSLGEFKIPSGHVHSQQCSCNEPWTVKFGPFAFDRDERTYRVTNLQSDGVVTFTGTWSK